MFVRNDNYRYGGREGRNGGLPKGNFKSRFLKANRRFFLPPYEPDNCHPESIHPAMS